MSSMQRAYVVSGSGRDGQRVPVGSSVVVGRDSSCGLVIRDLAASRRHLEIGNVNGVFRCRDLGSSNGTLVNGEAISSRDLRDGDEIRIGTTTLRFVLEREPKPAPRAKTVFLQTVVDASGRTETLPSSRSKELLEAAYTLMNALASKFDPCQLIDNVLETTMRAVRAQRGAVLFSGEGLQLEPCSQCGQVHTIRDGIPELAEIEEIDISESVARRVLQHGENVLFQSARTDEVADSSASITALHLTSILCVPIRTQNAVHGILYIDTDRSDHEYTADDMLLAAAAGNSAGLALENARIHRELLEKQRVEHDIEAAWTIQEGFLTRDWPVDDRRLDVYGVTRPARIIGGDFYDFARLDDDHVGLLIGDVSGKGVPAALTMALLLAEFRLCAAGADSTAEVLRRLNERMVGRSRLGTFCTAALVALNLRSGHLTAANAGHHPVLRIAGDEVRPILRASGPPLGIVKGLEWKDDQAVLEPGDTILLYTDGIAEARRFDGGSGNEHEREEFGLAGLARVARERPERGPQELIEAVLDGVDSYCSPMAPHDDCTMIALRYHGNG